MKVKVVLGNLLLGSVFVIGLCQASHRVDERVGFSDGLDDETGYPMMTPSTSLEDLQAVLLEGGNTPAEGEDVLTLLRFEKNTKKARKEVRKISPRTDAQVEADATAIKRAKGYGAIKNKNATS